MPSDDEADIVKGKYIAAVSRIRMGDFCLSHQVQSGSKVNHFSRLRYSSTKLLPSAR